jgi:acyl-homoserine-lactone acylase
MRISIFIYFFLFFLNTLSSQINPKNITIYRDSFGVPHIYGNTDADAAYGLAWAHSEDDFENIQHQLLAGKGMLGEVLGKDGVLFDFGLQFLGIDTFVDRTYEADVSPSFKKIVTAYCQAINDYAATHPTEVLLKKSLPFQPIDMIKSFTLNLSLMAGVGMSLKAIKENKIEDFFTPNEVGSNAFAVAPNRTEDGKAWLAINSHQPLEGRFAWYEAHVASNEGWNIIGGLFPGGTSIFVGSNEHLGWAHTVNYNTWGDIFLLKVNPKNKHQYEYDGQWKNFVEGKAKLKLKIGGIKLAVSKKLRFTEYGPVFKTKRGLFAIRFPSYRNLKGAEQWFNMNKAQNWQEFDKAIRMEGITQFNIIYADNAGNIFFQSNGAYPKRNPNLNWHYPITSSSAKYKWEKLIPFEDKPFVFNPSCGYVYNSNNTPLHSTGDECNWKGKFPGLQMFEYNRGERFRTMFKSIDEKYTWNDILRFKFDKHYEPNGMYRDRFKTVFDLHPEKYPDIAKSINMFKKWDLNNDVLNHEATLAMVTHYFMAKESKMPFAFLMIREKPIAEDFAVKNIRKAQSFLKKHYGSSDLALGEVLHHVRGDVVIPASGGFEVPRAADASLYDKKHGLFKVKGGDGYIQMTKFSKDKGAEILSVNAYGSSAHQESSHYTDQMQMFQKEEFKTMTFDRAKIEREAIKKYYPGEISYR